MSKLSKKTKEQFVKLLKEAKDDLWNGVNEQSGKSEYICFALPYIAGREELKTEIMRRLDSQGNVWSWLCYVGKVPRRALSAKAVQAHRLAWINLLIEEFSQP